jgi:hypothetical protein
MMFGTDSEIDEDKIREVVRLMPDEMLRAYAKITQAEMDQRADVTRTHAAALAS